MSGMESKTANVGNGDKESGEIKRKAQVEPSTGDIARPHHSDSDYDQKTEPTVGRRWGNTPTPMLSFNNRNVREEKIDPVTGPAAIASAGVSGTRAAKEDTFPSAVSGPTTPPSSAPAPKYITLSVAAASALGPLPGLSTSFVPRTRPTTVATASRIEDITLPAAEAGGEAKRKVHFAQQLTEERFLPEGHKNRANWVKERPYENLRAYWESVGSTLFLAPDVREDLRSKLINHDLPIVWDPKYASIVVVASPPPSGKGGGSANPAFLRYADVVYRRRWGIVTDEEWLAECFQLNNHVRPVDWISYKASRQIGIADDG